MDFTDHINKEVTFLVKKVTVPGTLVWFGEHKKKKAKGNPKKMMCLVQLERSFRQKYGKTTGKEGKTVYYGPIDRKPNCLRFVQAQYVTLKDPPKDPPTKTTNDEESSAVGEAFNGFDNNSNENDIDDETALDDATRQEMATALEEQRENDNLVRSPSIKSSEAGGPPDVSTTDKSGFAMARRNSLKKFKDGASKAETKALKKVAKEKEERQNEIQSVAPSLAAADDHVKSLVDASEQKRLSEISEAMNARQEEIKNANAKLANPDEFLQETFVPPSVVWTEEPKKIDAEKIEQDLIVQVNGSRPSDPGPLQKPILNTAIAEGYAGKLMEVYKEKQNELETVKQERTDEFGKLASEPTRLIAKGEEDANLGHTFEKSLLKAAEEKERLLDERKKEAERLKVEAQREKIAQDREEKKIRDAEKQKKREEERAQKEAEARRKEEEDRLAAEKAEKERMQQEHEALEAKLGRSQNSLRDTSGIRRQASQRVHPLLTLGNMGF